MQKASTNPKFFSHLASLPLTTCSLASTVKITSIPKEIDSAINCVKCKINNLRGHTSIFLARKYLLHCRHTVSSVDLDLTHWCAEINLILFPLLTKSA